MPAPPATRNAPVSVELATLVAVIDTIGVVNTPVPGLNVCPLYPYTASYVESPGTNGTKYVLLLVAVVTNTLPAFVTAVPPNVLAMSNDVTAELPTTRPLVSSAILTKLLPLPCITVANVALRITLAVPLKPTVGLLTSPLMLKFCVAVSIVAV